MAREVHGRVGVVRLVRPERRNALDREMAVELTRAFEEHLRSDAISAVVLSGSSGTFCAGGDLTTLEAAAKTDPVGTLEDFHRLILTIACADKPILAALSGAAAGFGADLALAADLRIAGESAFLQESFIHVGLLSDGGGTLFLRELVGPSRAFSLLALGQRISSGELLQLGVVLRVVPEDRLDEEALALATTLAARAPLAMGALKRTLFGPRRAALEAELERVREEQIRLLRSGDFSEGVSAFLEKRKPIFSGH